MLKGAVIMKKTNEALTNTSEEGSKAVQNGSQLPRFNNTPGDSVDELRNLEDANEIITGDEIRQQNENL
jgi:hypothetical protein